MRLFRQLIASCERVEVPLWQLCLTFLSSITIRNVLELLSSPYPPPLEAGLFINYSLFYIALALALLLFFYWLAREELLKIFKVLVPAFLIVVSVPLLDVALSGGSGYTLSFLIPELHGDLFMRFITFFGPLGEIGVSPGMRIEIAVAIIAAFLYVREKRNSILLAFAGVAGTYLIIFIFIAFPYLLSFLGVWSYQSPAAAALASDFFLLICGIELLTIARITRRELFFALLRDIRPERVAHYSLMMLLGFSLAYRADLPLDPQTIFSVLFSLLAIVSAWLFSVMTNNLADVDIDRVSSPERPLIRGAVEPKEYKTAGFVVLAAALIGAAAAGFGAFLVIAFFIANYFVYSMPPLRLKRVPYLSKLAILFNSLALGLLGFGLADPAQLQVLVAQRSQFPASLPPLSLALWIAFFLLVLLSINFIDLKDYEGDKRAGVKTLPVLLGMRTSQHLFGVSFFLSNLAVGLYFGGVMLYGAALVGAAQYVLITSTPYRERPVFWLYIASLVLFLFWSLAVY
jgi:4-hydroxybenzoate polyprenyltransferase